MPLMQGKSKNAFEHNIKTEMAAGKPQKQSLAIAYATKRHAMKKKMAKGGMYDEGGQVSQDDRSQDQNGKGPYMDPEAAKQMEAGATQSGWQPGEWKKNLKAGLGFAEGGKVPKLGTGKRFDKLEHSLSHEKGIHDPAALAASIGRKKYGEKKMNALAHHKHMSEGGIVDADDQAREYDEEPLMTFEEDHNEDLDPMDEPEHGAERMMSDQFDFDERDQSHETQAHPSEPKEHFEPDEENLPNHMDVEDVPSHMFSHGGIAHAIMKKHKMMMAEGGMVEYPDTDKVIDSGSYGHMGTTDRSMTNNRTGNTMDLDEHPDDDYLSDEEDTHYFHPNDMDEFEATARRKKMISDIMRGPHRMRA